LECSVNLEKAPAFAQRFGSYHVLRDSRGFLPRTPAQLRKSLEMTVSRCLIRKYVAELLRLLTNQNSFILICREDVQRFSLRLARSQANKLAAEL
jgi:hypothetical protein